MQPPSTANAPPVTWRARSDDALPVLQSFSANVIHMGGLGTGTVAKLVNNMLSFCDMAALTEGMMLGTKHGLDPDKLLHVIGHRTR